MSKISTSGAGDACQTNRTCRFQSFLTKSMVTRHIDVARTSPVTQPLSCVFSDAVMAAGYYACLPKQQLKLVRKTADRHLRAALRGLESIQALPSSLFKLQVS